MMLVSEALKRRRAIRDYDPEFVIGDEVFSELFALVSLTPSAMNLQPWEFILVKDAAAKKRLRACAMNQYQIELASATVVVLGNTDMLAHFEPVYDDLLALGGTSPERVDGSRRYVHRFDDDLRYRELWAARCAALAAMTLMLAAQELGLDSGPMDGFYADKLMAEFNVPAKFLPVMLVTLGRRAKEPPYGRQWRRGFADMVHIDSF